MPLKEEERRGEEQQEEQQEQQEEQMEEVRGVAPRVRERRQRADGELVLLVHPAPGPGGGPHLRVA